MTSEFRTLLSATEIDDIGGIWQLDQPLRYFSDLLKREITVPVGFKTDFASVPRILGVYDLEGGKCNKAAVVHDWLYSLGSSAGGIDRETADRVLREAIVASGYSAFDATAFYLAVRVLGGSHWRQDNVPQPPAVNAALLATAASMRGA